MLSLPDNFDDLAFVRGLERGPAFFAAHPDAGPQEIIAELRLIFDDLFAKISAEQQLDDQDIKDWEEAREAALDYCLTEVIKNTGGAHNREENFCSLIACILAAPPRAGRSN